MANLQFSFKTDWGLLEGADEDSFFHKDNLFMVVEGLGGEFAGKAARDISCRVIPDSFFKYMSEVPAPAEALTKALLEANQAVIDEAHRLGCKMAASVSVVYIQNHIMYFSHLGDSRVYCIHGAKINQLTRDHTLREEGPVSRSKSRDPRTLQALTRGLGVTNQLTVEVKKYPLERRDLIILTTDGFTSRISNKEILRYAQKYRNIETMGHHILSLAQKKGGGGEMTLGVIRYGVFSRATKTMIAAYLSVALVIVLLLVWYLAQFGGQKAGTENRISVKDGPPPLSEEQKERNQAAITRKKTEKITDQILSAAIAKGKTPEAVVNAEPIHAFLKEWKSAWEKTAGYNQDMDRYIALYSKDFFSRGMNRDAWGKDKSSKGNRKKWIRVELDNIRIAKSANADTIRVSFKQKYGSSNYASTSNKTLILRKEKGQWKIIKEISD